MAEKAKMMCPTFILLIFANQALCKGFQDCKKPLLNIGGRLAGLGYGYSLIISTASTSAKPVSLWVRMTVKVC